MKVILYAKSKKGAGKRLQEGIEAIVPNGNIQVCRTIRNLTRTLNRLGDGMAVAVLLAATKEELSEMLTKADILSERRLILVLPDGDQETAMKAHRLYPRYLSYRDRSFGDVVAVLKNMFRHTNQHLGGGEGDGPRV